MARCRRKRRSSTRKSRKAKKARKSRVSRPQRASYHHGLRDAIAAVLPGQFFSRWKVRAGIQWLPQRIFWLAVMMAWGVDQTFEAQFDTCRAVLRPCSRRGRWVRRIRVGTKRSGNGLRRWKRRCPSACGSNCGRGPGSIGNAKGGARLRWTVRGSNVRGRRPTRKRWAARDGPRPGRSYF